MNWKAEYLSCFDHSQWRDAEIDRALVLKQLHKPESLYKYGRFDKARYWAGMLENDLLRLSSPLDFNDPYDSSLSIRARDLADSLANHHWEEALRFTRASDVLSPDDIEKIRTAPNKFDALVQAFLRKNPSFTQEKLNELQRVLFDAMDEFRKPYLERLKNDLRNSLRVTCFSERPNSILMWSHYAKNHMGFCIEYETEHIMGQNPISRRCLHPVVYSDEVYDATDYLKSPVHQQNFAIPSVASCRKACAWEYEQEWRLVIPHGIATENPQFAMPRPRAVILGSRVAPEREDEIRELCGRRGIGVKTASLRPETFEVLII